MAVSPETKDFLDEAKKGKPRKFVMLVKGTTIVSLVVYKKGNATKFIKQAKEDGKGIPCFGLITGRGMDLNFQLAVSDGFEKPPIKDLILKKFLEEEAEFKCKPMVEIVATLGVALDADDPLHARFIKLQSTALEACEANPTEADRIGEACQKIGRLLDDDQRDTAVIEIDALEKLLAGLNPQETSGPTPEQLAYETLRSKLETLLLAAKKAAPDKALALGNVWNYAEAQAQAKNFANAKKALDGLADALKKTLAAPVRNDAAKFGIAEGIVAERRAKLEKYFIEQMAAARIESSNQIDAIGRVVEETMDDGADLGDLLQDAVDDLYDAASEELFGALETGSVEKVQAAVADWRKRVKSDPLLAHLRKAKSSLGVDAAIDADLNRLLDSVEKQLQTAA
ncbi:MAG: hypothetical protein K8U03_02390 [Planctomycetia bacterium]|nr:hypothetical protein [Planctomycetia bacterium]